MRFAFLSTFFLVAVSCAIQEKRSIDPGFSYTLQTFKHTSENCNQDSASCARYEVTYPVFSGLDSLVTRTIEQKINASVSMGNPEANGWNMQQIANEFVKGFDDFRKETEDMESMEWYYQANVSVELSIDTLISLSVQDEYYTGGAHGGSNTYFINIHPKSGKEVTLRDLLKPGFEKPLTQLGEKAFKTVHDLKDSVSYSNFGFDFPDNKFQLNDNYGFPAEGIMFVFNSYEIAPYAVGPTTIIIPYEQLKDWLK
jgi:hypothetical protein